MGRCSKMFSFMCLITVIITCAESINLNISANIDFHQHRKTGFHVASCKRRYSKSRVAYYHNSVSSFQLLLTSGDIEKNPGPVKSNKKQKSVHKPKCPECLKTVATNRKRLACAVCFSVTHLNCISSYQNTKHITAKKPVN